jgi:hypothetical protein
MVSAGALLAALLLAAGPLLAAEDACAQLPKPSVTVKRLEDPAIRYNTDYGYRTLTNLGRDKLTPGSQVLGLTRTQSIAQFSLTAPAVVDASQRYECASPQITLSIGFRQMTVYVGKEFPRDSCAYKEILEHEMRHVKAYQEHIATVEKLLQEDIARRFATDSVWRGEAGSSLARVSKELDERWLPYVNRQLHKVDQAQALIDAPEEYTRLADACNGEIKKLTR